MKYTTETVTISRLMNDVDEERLDLETPYQRGDVWDMKRRVDLIYSLLSDFPIGEMEWDARRADEDVYGCVEGKQRTLTIQRFLKDRFSLPEDFPLIGENEDDLSGKIFSELDSKFKNKILNTQISVVMINKATDEEVVNHFYFRNNGKNLSNIEKSHAIAMSRDKFAKIADEGIILDLTTKAGYKGHKHIELAQKSYAMLFMENTDFSSTVFNPYIFNVVVTDSQVQDTINCLDYISQFYNGLDNALPDENNIRKLLRKSVHFTSAVYFMNRCIANDVEASVACEKMKEFFSNIPAAYTDTTIQGTARPTMIRERKEAIENYLENEAMVIVA